jgi:hypothetical protein
VYAACAVGILYAVHFAFVPASMREAFFGRWLPLASSRYAAYHWGWDHVFSLKTLHVSALLVVALWLPWREPYRAMMRRAAPFVMFGFGSSLVMISQHKGWPYHLIPMAAGIYLTAALVLAEVMQHQVDETPAEGGGLLRIQRRVLTARPVLLIVLVGAWYASVVAHSPTLFQRHRSPTAALIRRVTAEDDAVAYLTTAVQTVYPEAFHTGRKPGTRYLWTFPIAYLFEGRRKKLDQKATYVPPPERTAEHEQLIADLTEDIATRRPKLVFVWRGNGCQGCPPHFVIARYLQRSGFYERALGDYYQTKRIGYWDVWARNDVDLPRKGRSRHRGRRR